MSEPEFNVRPVYRRAALGLAAAAILWFFAWVYAERAGWQERTLVIPIGCAALSIIFFSLYLKSKPSTDDSQHETTQRDND